MERNSWTPELAELRAIEVGLEMAREEGIVPVLVELDCHNAILKLQRQESSRLEIGVRVREIQDQANQLGSVEWWFGRREGNRATHAMAHVRCDWETHEKWAERPPIFLLDLLSNEALAH
ncbi:unnamed protein product [Linum trigynum]